MLIIYLLVRINLGGPAFFLQERVGKDNKVFKMIKFRTMRDARDKNGNLLSDNERVTKFGSFLRSFSLDELPELINIFLGQLAIVGPRPFLVRDCVFMTDDQRKRHDVRQGLTGLAQVNGRNNITWEQKFEYDLKYINDGITLIGDIKIIFRTFGKVFERSDTVREGTFSDVDFGDWLLMEGKVDQKTYDEKQLEANVLLEV